jgi:hypothetical protein
VSAVAVLAALFLWSGNLAAHEGLNQPQGGWVGLSVAPIPSEMGNIGALNLKKDDRVMILFDACKSVIGANHACWPRYRHRDGAGPMFGNQIYSFGDIFFEFRYRQSDVKISMIGVGWEQHDAIVKQFSAYWLCSIRTAIFSLDKIRAERREQFGMGGRRFTNVIRTERTSGLIAPYARAPTRTRALACFDPQWPNLILGVA